MRCATEESLAPGRKLVPCPSCIRPSILGWRMYGSCSEDWRGSAFVEEMLGGFKPC